MTTEYKKHKKHIENLNKDKNVDEKKFVETGLEIVNIIYENLSKLPFVHSMIGVSTDQYKIILRAAYRKDYSHMSTGKKDGTNRKLRFEKEVMLFFDADDGRILLPFEMLMQRGAAFHNKTIYGAELNRRVANGESLNLFQYNESGDYLGCMINGKLVSPENLNKPAH